MGVGRQEMQPPPIRAEAGVARAQQWDHSLAEQADQALFTFGNTVNFRTLL